MSLPSANELLADARWLRRLAKSLVLDDAEADDLAQQTWLAAAQAQPQDDRPLRPWLARVLRNFVGMAQRRAAVRARELPEPDAAPTPTELLDRLQTQRLVARLLAELAEPYRTTLLLRYFEGLDPAEIAHLQQVPAGTVRWRHKVGLERLRAALDRSTGDRNRWMIALAPLAALRAPPTLHLLKGIVMVSRPVRLAALVMLLLSLGLLAVRSGRKKTASGPAKAPAVAHAPAPPSRGVPAIRLAPVVIDQGEASFEGTVLNWSTGDGVARAELTFASGGAAASVMADEKGRFRYVPPHSGRYTLQVAS